MSESERDAECSYEFSSTKKTFRLQVFVPTFPLYRHKPSYKLRFHVHSRSSFERPCTPSPGSSSLRFSLAFCVCVDKIWLIRLLTTGASNKSTEMKKKGRKKCWRKKNAMAKWGEEGKLRGKNGRREKKVERQFPICLYTIFKIWQVVGKMSWYIYFSLPPQLFFFWSVLILFPFLRHRLFPLYFLWKIFFFFIYLCIANIFRQQWMVHFSRNDISYSSIYIFRPSPPFQMKRTDRRWAQKLRKFLRECLTAIQIESKYSIGLFMGRYLEPLNSFNLFLFFFYPFEWFRTETFLVHFLFRVVTWGLRRMKKWIPIYRTSVSYERVCRWKIFWGKTSLILQLRKI